MELTKEQLDIVEKVKGKRIPGLWDVRCQQYMDNKSKTSTKKAVKVDSTSQTIRDSLLLFQIMAFYRGEEGSVKFKNGAGTVAAVASTRSWNFSITKDVLETTAHGATTRAYVGSFIDGNGSVELLYTATTGDETQEFLKDVLVAQDAADAQFELYLSTSGSKKLAFNGLVTGAEFSTSVGDLQVVNISFQMNGALTADAI